MDNLTDITVIFDRSGSMSGIWTDAVGGLKHFIEEQQQADGDANFSLVAFDTEYEKLCTAKDITLVDPDIAKRVSPRGGTALYDAIGTTLTETEARLKSATLNAPDEVFIVIVTDGEENSSKEWKEIKTLIERLQDERDWKFFFLAADQDAFRAANAMGIAAAGTANYTNTSMGTQAMYTAMSGKLGAMRSGTSSYTDETWKKGIVDDQGNELNQTN